MDSAIQWVKSRSHFDPFLLYRPWISNPGKSYFSFGNTTNPGLANACSRGFQNKLCQIIVLSSVNPIRGFVRKCFQLHLLKQQLLFMSDNLWSSFLIRPLTIGWINLSSTLIAVTQLFTFKRPLCQIYSRWSNKLPLSYGIHLSMQKRKVC